MLNIPLIEATRRLSLGGGISLKGFFLLIFYYLRILVSMPFSFLQFLLFHHRIRKTVIEKDPVYILGHYRSGTTYLQKLLASDRQFGCLTNYDALLANANLLFGRKMEGWLQRMINLLKIQNPFFHDSIVRLSEPTEEDDYLMNRISAYSAYWGLLFPRRWREWLNGEHQFRNERYRSGWKKEHLKTLKYITFKHKGKQLVLKSPPNTERIKVILELFPRAKFIFIYRNPYHLYYSIRNMWKKAILGYYSLQTISEEELDEIIFEHFIYLTDQYEREKHLIPEGNLMEISYEDLKADPFQSIERIYAGMGMPGFESTAQELRKEIEMEKDYQNFRFHFTEAEFSKIKDRWGKYIRQWNY